MPFLFKQQVSQNLSRMLHMQARIREIPAQDKLQYLYSLLSAVLPVVNQIHREQCTELEMEKKLRGWTPLYF